MITSQKIVGLAKHGDDKVSSAKTKEKLVKKVAEIRTEVALMYADDELWQFNQQQQKDATKSNTILSEFGFAPVFSVSHSAFGQYSSFVD